MHLPQYYDLYFLITKVAAMTILTESAYIESKSLRDNQVAELSHQRAEDILRKVKSLYFALWQGTGTTTTSALVDYYEVSGETIQKVIQRHRDELNSDGLKRIRGKVLKDVVDILSISKKTPQLTIWTPRAALRLGMLLKDSEIAKAVRTSLLNTVEKVIPSVTHPQSNAPALPSAKDRLETICMGMDLLERLGGCDERTQIQLKDQVRNILLAEKLQRSPKETTLTQTRLEYPVSDRAVFLGYRPDSRQLQQIGKQASRLYQERHDTKPIQREQFVGGTTRMVNVYGFQDLYLLDQAIFSVMDK